MQGDNNLYDVVIVGGGPAGLSAALYAARAKYKVLVLEKGNIGGQITITSEIVNYPGTKKCSGSELTEQMRQQAVYFGAEFAVAEVLDMELKEDIKVLHTTKGDFQALGVILALGANPRKLGFRGEKEFQGRGVAYCATCDGEFFAGKDIFVIGGGFAAVEEGIFLTKYAKKVIMIVREEDFTCAKTVADQVKNYDNIQVHFETEVVEVGGEEVLSYARFVNNRTGEQWEHRVDPEESFGMFVFAGYVPNTDWISKEIKLDKQGYIITDVNQKTNLEGVYAAGDVCVKNLRQVVTAVSDGATAATALEKVVAQQHEKLGIPELLREKESSLSQDEQNSFPDILENRQKETNTDGQTQEHDGHSGKNDGFINHALRNQLVEVFSKFQQKVLLKLWLDDTPLSGEMLGFVRELSSLTDMVSWKKAEEKNTEHIRPSIELCHEDGASSGVQFHGVPGGHEFNSFVVALYNVAGPGQNMETEILEKFRDINKDINVKILVSLSCTMCPETVMSAQKAATVSEHVTAEMFDLSHFPKLRDKYKVMSVPCMILNDSKVIFGKKNVSQMADILTEL